MTTVQIDDIVDLNRHPLSSSDYAAACRETLENQGALVLEGFLRAQALATILNESRAGQDQAYFCESSHSVYLSPPESGKPLDHPVNRQVKSTKGCICDDMVSATSPLRALYEAQAFRQFIARTTGQPELHPYADPLSSINIHYASRGQELGWHFDNSSFAITLLIQKADAGSRFEYVKGLRDTAAGDMNFDGVRDLLDGRLRPEVLSMDPGTLVLFRGRDSVHRVSPNESDTTRILAVLAYNSEAGIELSESARMTFYGRLG